MTRLLRTLLLVAFATTAVFAQDMSTTIQAEAKKCAKALVSADFDAVIAYTHKRVLGLVGGKEGMMTLLKRGSEDMHAQGISFQGATIGEVGKPTKIDTWLVALVPQHVTMKIPGGRLEQDSHLLGISEDDGKTWVFVDVSNRESIEKAFPEVVGKVELPERKKPVFVNE